jgi:hypothetical protein
MNYVWSLMLPSVMQSLLPVAAVLWAVFKSSEWYRSRRSERFAEAMGLLEAAVEETYQTYVREIKRGREDGKLTETERAEARRRAKERALAFARERGIDLLERLGRDLLDIYITWLVKKLKRR